MFSRFLYFLALFANCVPSPTAGAVCTRPAFARPLSARRTNCGSVSTLSACEDDNLFESEEAAAFDAHDVSDAGIEAAAMERAVMMAKELADARRHTLEAKHHEAKGKAKKMFAKAKEVAGKATDHLKVSQEHVDNFKVAEKAYENLENLIQSAVKAEKDDLGSLEHVFSEEDVADLAVLMLENAHTAAAEKILETEEKVSAAATTFQAAMGENEMAKAMASQAAADAKAADDRMTFIEEFSGPEEIMERRRDLSISHTAHHVVSDAEKAARAAAVAMRRAKEEENKAAKQLEALKRNEAELKADLQELRSIIVEKASDDWQKKKKKMQH